MHRTYMRVSLCGPRGRGAWRKTGRSQRLPQCEYTENAMGVGIPGTGMVGLPIAIALGVVAGKSAYGLEVLKDVMPTDVELGKQYIAERRVKISLKEGISEKLYVEAIVESESGHRATAVIAGQHTHFVYVEKDGKVLLDNRMPQGEEAGEDECELNLRKVYDFQ